MQRTTFLAACAATSALGAFPSIGGAAELDENLETPTGTIYGTLTLPVGRAKPPVVLVIAGSGPTDRNGNASTLVLNMYAKLAAALAERGIATVRYDKRGIAASHAAAPDETSLRFDAYVADAAAWIRKLRADGRFSSVTVVGHSEGSLVGMIAAQSVPVDAYVSLEGAGFPANVVLARQLATNLAPYPELKAQSDRILASLALGKLVVASDVPAPLLSLFRPSVQPYLISWFAYDPRVEIVKTTGRVTIVQGTHDVQVSVDDGKGARRRSTERDVRADRRDDARPRRRSGNDDCGAGDGCVRRCLATARRTSGRGARRRHLVRFMRNLLRFLKDEARLLKV